MATTNPVYQVLIPTGNQAPLATGSRMSALAVGQVGVFNFHTGLSVDATSPVGDLRDIVIAVGLDVNSAGSLQDIATSAGQMIQTRNAKSIGIKGYVDSIAKVIEITGFKAKCEADYGVKIEFRNQRSYGINGYNQFTKTFNFFTGCCADPCDTCSDGDCLELAKGIVDNINADLDALVTAAMFSSLMVGTINTEPTADGNITVTLGTEVFTVAILNADTAAQVVTKIVAAINAVTTSAYYAVTTGTAVLNVRPKVSSSNFTTVIVYGAGATGSTMNAISTSNTTITDTAAFAAANPGVCLGIRLTANIEALNALTGNINLKYYSPRGTDMIVSLVEGFNCNGVVTTTVDMQYPEGKGYDIKQLEYIAGGWNGKPGPYRVSELNGVERGGYQLLASNAVNYNVIALTYDQMSVGGWLEYLNNLATIIAIPCADSTTLTGLVAIFDVIFTQFGPMTNDVATMDCTNGATSALTVSTDGIESLA